MQLDTLAQTTLTMSSREIASLIGKRHDNIKVSTERLVEKGVIGTPAMQEFVHNGNTYTEYLLNKRDSLVLVAQNCPEFTAAIIDRWQQLEESTSKIEVVDPRTKALIDSLIRFDALEQEQKRMERKQHQLESRLDQIETAQDHFTVVGYATAFNKGSIPLELSAKIGAKAAKHCKASGIEMGNVPDPRFGRVKTYPKAVLDLVFGTYEPKALAA